jgi:hypothetical protein
MAEPATLPSGPIRSGPRLNLLGPLFYLDLVRQARQGRVILLRCAYALFLFVTLRLAFVDQFPLHDLESEFQFAPVGQSARGLHRISQRFVLSVLQFQTAAAFLLTPVCVASAFVEERKRHTFDVLLTTHLSDREIVTGKLASRLLQLLCVLLTGMPVMALTLLWGGVDFRVLLATFLVTMLNVGAVAAFSIFISLAADTISGAMLGSYAFSGFAFVVNNSVCMTPDSVFEMLMRITPRPHVPVSVAVSVGIAFDAVAIVAFCRYAVRGLREVDSRSSEPARLKNAVEAQKAFELADENQMADSARRRPIRLFARTPETGRCFGKRPTARFGVAKRNSNAILLF